MDKKSSLLMLALSEGRMRLNGVTYYLQGGRVRVCNSKRGAKKTRSAGEEISSNRFTEARKMWKIYRRAVGLLPIWRIWAKERGLTKSDSAFHSVNGGCLRPGEGVWAFPTFRFSVGTLDAPVITGVERSEWKVTLRWENGLDCSKVRLSDRVYVGYFYDSHRKSPQLALTSATRSDECVSVEIPSVDLPTETPLHLYLFFGSEDDAHFSPSEYVLAGN